MATWQRKQDPYGFEVAEFIISGIIPLGLIVLGTVTNFFSIFVLLNKEHRKSSTNIYLIFLCLMDTFSLYQWNFQYMIYEFTAGTNQVINQSLFLCKAGIFLAFYTLHTSAMFLTLIAIDRAFLLWNVRWYKNKIARPKIALVISIVVLLLFVIINGFLFGLGVDFSYFNPNTQSMVPNVVCYYSLDMGLLQFFANQYPWVHLVLMYILPFTVMLICTLVTVRKLTRNRNREVNDQLAQNAKRNVRISVMLMVMWSIYFVFTLPNRLCFSVFVDALINHPYSDTVFLTSNTLMYTRNALNGFLLYASIVSFRREVRRFAWKLMGKTDIRIYPQETLRCTNVQSSMKIDRSNTNHI